MSELLLNKDLISRSVRDAALDCLAAGARKVRRPSKTSGFVEFDEVYLSIGVQHAQWKADDTFTFCVNFGALPKRMFYPHWTGFERKYPTVLDSVYQSRLHPEFGCGEFWWDISEPREFDQAIRQVAMACEQIRTKIYPRVASLEGCVKAFNIPGPAWRAKLDQWLKNHA